MNKNEARTAGLLAFLNACVCFPMLQATFFDVSGGQKMKLCFIAFSFSFRQHSGGE
jgi:cytochrome c biogenesis protein CcdA